MEAVDEYSSRLGERGQDRSRKIGGRIFVELDSVFGLFTRKEGQDR
jgi:hypothetical protein